MPYRTWLSAVRSVGRVMLVWECVSTPTKPDVTTQPEASVITSASARIQPYVQRSKVERRFPEDTYFNSSGT